MTTDRIIWKRVAPRANAPSRSPGGAREKTSRVIEAMMGTIMMPTTRPATNSDDVTGGLTTLKMGMKARWRDSQVLKPTMLGWSSKKPHSP